MKIKYRRMRPAPAPNGFVSPTIVEAPFSTPSTPPSALTLPPNPNTPNHFHEIEFVPSFSYQHHPPTSKMASFGEFTTGRRFDLLFPPPLSWIFRDRGAAAMSSRAGIPIALRKPVRKEPAVPPKSEARAQLLPVGESG